MEEKFKLLPVFAASLPEVKHTTQLFRQLSSLLDGQDCLFDEIWPDQYHEPDRPHYFFIKYRTTFLGDALGLWYYLDTPNKRALHEWCGSHGLLLSTDWNCEQLHSAACHLIIITQAFSLYEARLLWTDADSLFQRYRDMGTVRFFLSLSESQALKLYQWAQNKIPQYFFLFS